MKKKRKPLTITVSNPEALDKAGDRYIEIIYEMYIKSLIKEKKEIEVFETIHW